MREVLNLKKALIFGVTGQDGSYLAELLIEKGYEVHGVKRRSSTFNTERIDHIYGHEDGQKGRVTLHFGDVLDNSSVNNLIRDLGPDECYNLAAQSHVGVSFELPQYTTMANALGALNVLQAIKDFSSHTKLYNAASSEVFGNAGEFKILNEVSEMMPVSPYAASKLFALNMTKIYRDAYRIFAVNGILFNHESPRRGGTFVTRKIVKGLVSIFRGENTVLYLGNLSAKRDWGHAKDYVKAMHLMLQQNYPKDFIVATGENHSVQEFIEQVCEILEEKVRWEGSGDNLSLFSLRLNRKIVVTHARYYRPLEVNNLCGDSSAIRKELGWAPQFTFPELVAEMVHYELGQS